MNSLLTYLDFGTDVVLIGLVVFLAIATIAYRVHKYRYEKEKN